MKPSTSMRRNALLALLCLAVLISACGTNSTPMVVSTATLSQPTQLPPTPTLTPEPPNVLNICLAEDPGSLFRYEGRESLAKQSVFAALYDKNILFGQSPTYTNGQASKTALDVKPGMNVLDGNGKLTVLKEGSLIHPVIEGQLGEQAAWTASVPLQMMQVRVEYKLTAGLLWSDGSPLTSADFLLSFEVAQTQRNPQDIWLLERTERLEGLDDTTIAWTGIPGFVPVDLSGLVFLPLPAAQFEGVNPEAIGTTVAANYTPLAWGAYRIIDRAPDLGIYMERNPFYDPKPAYDQVVFLVEPDLQQAINKLASGECDVLDPSYHLEGQGKDVLTGLAQTGSLVAENFDLVQQLVFGIQPAAYDIGYSPWTAVRQDFFGDFRTRQALASCLTAEPIATEVLHARLPEGFSLPDFTAEVTLADAQALLDEIGWQVDAAEPNAPRKASRVVNVLDGTVFSVNLLSSTSAMDNEVSQGIIRRLGQCGIQVIHQALSPDQLFAPGPEGPLFGRNFDLALVSWQPTPANTCELYRLDAIPNNHNYWIGTNLAGLADTDFDIKCTAVQNVELLPTLNDRVNLIEDFLPALPLMPRITLWAASSRVNLIGSSAFDEVALWQPLNP